MLTNIVLMVIDAVVSLFAVTLLLRFYMQWLRVSFRNPLGEMVTQLTNWMVLPLRRIIPGLGGLDLASLIPAILIETAGIIAEVMLRGVFVERMPLPLPLGVLLVGVLSVLKLSIWMLIIIVFASVILSWVNPYSPIAPVLNNLSRPFLKPFQRFIPPIGNVDLSPVVLLLLLQIGLMVLGQVRYTLLPMVSMGF